MIHMASHVTDKALPTNLGKVSEPLGLLSDAPGEENKGFWLFVVFLHHNLDGSVAELRVVAVLV